MKLNHLWAACTTFVVAGIVIACSGSATSTNGDGGIDGVPGTSGGTSGGGTSGGTSGTSGGTSGTSGGSGTSGNPPASCALTPGTYKSHYTKAAGSLPACTDIPDQTFEVKASDGGTPQPSPGCTSTTDDATCTFTTVCTIKNAGYTTNTNSHFSTKPPIGGSQSSKTTKDATGSVISDCSYDFTYTLVR